MKHSVKSTNKNENNINIEIVLDAIKAVKKRKPKKPEEAPVEAEPAPAPVVVAPPPSVSYRNVLNTWQRPYAPAPTQAATEMIDVPPEQMENQAYYDQQRQAYLNQLQSDYMRMTTNPMYAASSTMSSFGEIPPITAEQPLAPPIAEPVKLPEQAPPVLPVEEVLPEVVKPMPPQPPLPAEKKKRTGKGGKAAEAAAMPGPSTSRIKGGKVAQWAKNNKTLDKELRYRVDMDLTRKDINDLKSIYFPEGTRQEEMFDILKKIDE